MDFWDPLFLDSLAAAGFRVSRSTTAVSDARRERRTTTRLRWRVFTEPRHRRTDQTANHRAMAGGSHFVVRGEDGELTVMARAAGIRDNSAAGCPTGRAPPPGPAS